jgi:hypothetical protein
VETEEGEAVPIYTPEKLATDNYKLLLKSKEFMR